MVLQSSEVEAATKRRVRGTLAEAQGASRRPRDGRAMPPRWAWGAVALAVGLAALSVALIMSLTRQGQSPVARTPPEAVQLFWQAVIRKDYEEAIRLYPGLVKVYGSKAQATAWLAKITEQDPPVSLHKLGTPHRDYARDVLRVPYTLKLRSGNLRAAEALVRDRNPNGGWLIEGGI